MCVINIIAQDNVARVIFDGTDNLGVLIPDYIMGQPYSIEQGESVSVAIYNGNERGTLEFTVSFSAA